jgi:site-specific DNA-cytosine methylase
MQEVWSVDSIASNSMKSSNPHSGFHKSKVIKTLDTSVPDPSKNQGGHIVMEDIAFQLSGDRDNPSVSVSDKAYCLPANPMSDRGQGVCMEEKVSGTDLFNGAITGDKACTLGTRGSSTNASGPTVLTNTVVRRLTPIECERLQGFPDNYTNIPWRNKPTAPDTRRYKALGNSMAVPVMRWIGRRIEAAEPIERDERAIERALYVTPGDDEQLTLF